MPAEIEAELGWAAVELAEEFQVGHRFGRININIISFSHIL